MLRPTCVTSLSGTQIEAVAAGLWHTICICTDGRVYAFGGHQFGQLGLGTNSDQCEAPEFQFTLLVLNIEGEAYVGLGRQGFDYLYEVIFRVRIDLPTID
ncbi:unnamed protein product [Fraxinus pennsylvanica]|uniref:Uncharacterized protein n=1 Tax=Fraxinus pennsylvanica TaxID=56036 RepID=A0AAD2DT86_9LAMI|nr:unnamed protein product [Fraxinus pennsylvanica]